MFPASARICRPDFGSSGAIRLAGYSTYSTTLRCWMNLEMFYGTCASTCLVAANVLVLSIQN